MPVIRCPRCEYETADDSSEAIAIALLNAHATSHLPNNNTAPVVHATVRGAKHERPKIDVGVSLEEWNVFTRRLDAFVTGSGLDPANYSAQLFQCAGQELGDAMLKMDSTITSGANNTLLATMKRLAVIAVAPGVLRSELMQMQQDREQTFRTFAAAVHGKAKTFCYINDNCTVRCDFTHSMVKDDNIQLVEAKETARNAMPVGSAALSSFMRNQKTKLPQQIPPPPPSQMSPCPN